MRKQNHPGCVLGSFQLPSQAGMLLHVWGIWMSAARIVDVVVRARLSLFAALLTIPPSDLVGREFVPRTADVQRLPAHAEWLQTAQAFFGGHTRCARPSEETASASWPQKDCVPTAEGCGSRPFPGPRPSWPPCAPSSRSRRRPLVSWCRRSQRNLAPRQRCAAEPPHPGG